MLTRNGAILLLAVAFAACGGVQANPGGSSTGTTGSSGGGSGSGGSGSGGSGGSSGGSGSSGTYGICDAAHACPSGQFCFNGICAVGCNTNQECAADQYCDTDAKQCRNKTVTTCPATPCASSQVCTDGFCSTPSQPTSGQCTPSSDGNDGCDPSSVCIEGDNNSNQCHTFPACAQDNTCPTGTIGAVCNNGYIQNKAHICLTGLCHDVSNCPANWKCIKANTTNVLGACSNGSPGMACTQPSDCMSGQCNSPGAGWMGLCS